ncbi:MAG: Spy/CpxP family protein refolding chaperone [Planctomycetaceae bacterium]
MSFIRSAGVFGAVCSAAFLLSSPVFAQPPGGGGQRGGFGQRGPGGFGGPGGGQMTVSRAQLLRSDDVQQEIGITDAQSVTVKAALEAYQTEREANRPDFGSFRDMSEEDRNKAFDKMRKEAGALNQKTDDVLNALLDQDQVKRLDEIALQLRARFGLAALVKSDEMKQKLSLKDEQLAKLEEAEKAAREAQQKAFEDMRARFRDGGNRDDGNNGGDRPDPRAAMEKMRQEATDAVMAILTDEQKAKLTEMQGKPFEVDMRSLMGGRNGFGGRGGQGGPGGEGDGQRGGRQGRRRPAADNNDSI